MSDLENEIAALKQQALQNKKKIHPANTAIEKAKTL